MEGYLERIDKSLGAIGNGALGVAFGLIGVAAWRFAVWNAARTAAEKKHRMDEFQSLTAIALELRSLRAQLSFATLLPLQESFLALPSGNANQPRKRASARALTKGTVG
jgi:hypothetical protein